VGAAAAPFAAAGKGGGNTTALGITMVPVVLEGLSSSLFLPTPPPSKP
jgi:hypothetical protein